MQIDAFELDESLLYTLPADPVYGHSEKVLRPLLEAHPEVMFVSLWGVDIAGHDTDERIPISLFLDRMDDFLNGSVQTDGSSVVLPEIATINNAKVDFIADSQVNWFVDYNYENRCPANGKPCGTLRVPAFLRHNGELVCSRSLLKRALENFEARLPQLFDLRDYERFEITAATELEFWVRTPDDIISREHLSVSQGLKESYWKRTKGIVRTALEQAVRLLELYGFHPEMGHKEVGGVQAHLSGSGNLDHIMEQLEIDWRYDEALQAVDNELMIRILIKEIFRLHGLEVSFLAKPLPGVAGSGEHLHINAVAYDHEGKRHNLFSPVPYEASHLSPIGWGALMGLMKHYNEAIAPFVTATNDALRRLRPGYEAPTHAVASIGDDLLSPSRNRTVLLCLIRSPQSPKATRFELRSPNPHSNLYFSLSAVCQAMLDGLLYVSREGKSMEELEAEFRKNAGEEVPYLRKEHEYYSEVDIFKRYDEAERDRRYGRPADTVFASFQKLLSSPEALQLLLRDGVFLEKQIYSYMRAMLEIWSGELKERLLEENLERIRHMKEISRGNSLDEARWKEIQHLRCYLAKSSEEAPSLFDRIREALATQDLKTANHCHREMEDCMERLEQLYSEYQRNQI